VIIEVLFFFFLEYAGVPNFSFFFFSFSLAGKEEGTPLPSMKGYQHSAS